MTIDELLGLAVGCIGMSIDDFDRCTPLEFESICGKWHEARDQAYRTGWDQVRQLACCVLQPYSKKAISPEDVITFSWEKTDRQPRAPETCEQREAERRRYEELKKARGLS